MEDSVLRDLDKAIDKLNSMSEAAVNRSYFMPIATAPRDGTNILALKDGVMAIVRWLPVEQIWAPYIPGTITLYQDWDPQMWMPLPPLPKNGG